MKDLVNLKPPNARNLEEFYAIWRTIIIDINDNIVLDDLQMILEQKMEDSKMFEYEL